MDAAPEMQGKESQTAGQGHLTMLPRLAAKVSADRPGEIGHKKHEQHPGWRGQHASGRTGPVFRSVFLAFFVAETLVCCGSA